MSRRQRGYILLAVLTLGLLALFLGTHCALQVVEFDVLGTWANGERADECAGALQESAVARLMYDPSWTGGIGKRDFEDAPARGFLTFDKTLSVPYAFNNAGGTGPALGWNGRMVPPGYVHLVSNATSPDNDPDRLTDGGRGIRVVRQGLVNPYRIVWTEDFNLENKGKPRHEWRFSDRYHIIKNRYCFLGGFDHHDVSWAQAVSPAWKNYDLDAVVAYYGQKGFGMAVRTTDKDGYCVVISPVHRDGAACGASVQFFSSGAFGHDFAPFSDTPPDASLVLPGGDETTNPFLAQGPTYELEKSGADVRMVPHYALPMGLWHVTLSVEDERIGVRVATLAIDPKSHAIVENGRARTIWTQLKGKRQYERGSIAFFSEPDTVVGFTNVQVKIRGPALISIPARWYGP